MHLRAFLPTSVVVLLSAFAPAGAIDLTGNNPPDGLRAVLDAPTLFGSGPCTARVGAKIQLRQQPSNSAAAAGMLEAPPIAAGQNACSEDVLVPRVRKPGDAWTSPVPTREFKRGHPGLILTDAQSGWYRIMLGDGEAWMPAPPSSVAYEYGSIVVLQPIHTLRGWDGRVCSSPRLDDCRKMSMPANPALRITRMQPVGADLWFKLDFGISACEGAPLPGHDVMSGWIPAFGPPGPDGKRPLTVWMDPRGC